MPTENLTDKRMSKFKNKGKEPTVSCCVELRKAQRVESILKRRNISSNSHVYNTLETHCFYFVKVTSATIQEIVANVNRDCPEKQRQGCQAEVVESGLLTHFVEFLGRHDDPTLQFEAAWSLANVHGAVPAFIALLASPMLNISEQAVWALGNIAGDCPSYRDALTDCGVILALLALLMLDVGYLRNLTWTLSNLCSNKNPFPRFRAVQQMLRSIIQLLHHSDKSILSDACWAISYLTEGPNEWIDVVIKTGILPRLVELLGFEELAVVVSTLVFLAQTQAAIDAGVLSALPHLMRHPKSSVQKEAAWAVSNIAAGPCQQIQQLITCVDCWLLYGGTVDQVVHLVKCSALEAILNLLQVKDTKTVLVMLDTINNTFLAAEKLGEVDKLCLLVEEVGGLDRIEFLQNHENNAVYRAAHSEKYFSEVGVSSDFFVTTLYAFHSIEHKISFKECS
uniref:Importin subunit alpha n=1 Tax=Sinocyclocheilus rhinocerous TaxID=307959 RepID=A0A673HME4_9TELE